MSKYYDLVLYKHMQPAQLELSKYYILENIVGSLLFQFILPLLLSR